MKLHQDIQPDFHYKGDARLLEKVFSNVLDNAVAYSPRGAVVTVTLQDGVLSVENSGIHIEQEDLERLFTPFYRVDKSRNRKRKMACGLWRFFSRTDGLHLDVWTVSTGLQIR